MKPSVIDRKYQCEVFNSVYGDVEKAKRVSSSPVRMFYEKRIFDLAHRGMNTSNYSCLDLGCGRGVFTQLLVDKFHHVVATDFAINALFSRSRKGNGGNIPCASNRRVFNFSRT